MATTSLPPLVAANTPHNRYVHSQTTSPSPPEAYVYSTGTYATPMSNTPPSNEISPTNSHSHLKIRQIRQPRHPLYVPAALRPTTDANPHATDIPGRPTAPDTPPSSKDNSFDSVKADSPRALDFAGFQDGTYTYRDGGGGGGGGMNTLLSQHGHNLNQVAAENLDDDFGDVTGIPTTAHWKPDESSNVCAVCNATFTWFFRRHHCRRCGSLVCDTHIKHTVPLDQNARYNPKGVESKACTTCWEGWRFVKRLRHSRANSIAESSNSSQGTAMPIPNPSFKMHGDNSAAPRIGSMARSEGMVWSTF